MRSHTFRRPASGVAALVVGAVLWSSPVLACLNDAECSDADVCSLPDTCLNGSCAPGGGGDLNLDGVCDADEQITLTYAKFKMNSPAPGQTVVSIRGALHRNATYPFEPIAGTTFVVSDAGTFTGSRSFPAADCVTIAKSVRCKTGRETGKVSRVTFKFLPPNGQDVLFKAKLAQLPGGGPFQEPIYLDLSMHGSTMHRFGSIIDCAITTRGLKCRQF